MSIKWAFLNDQFLKEENAFLHISDLSIQRGYGVFDFLKTKNNVPLFIEDHLDRFYYSAQKMRLSLNFLPHQLKEIILELIHKNNISNSGIRITLTGGYAMDGYQVVKPNLFITQQLLQQPAGAQKGMKLVTYEYQRELADVKTINYAMGIWLQSFIKENGADEVLYYKNRIISECPRANFFIVMNDDKIVTPSQEILNGITRKKILELAKPCFAIEERNVFIEDLQQAKEAFITSTTKKVMPVTQIDNKVIGNQSTGPVTQQIATLLKKAQDGYLLHPTV